MFKPSFELCAEYFEYNPDTGRIFWRKADALNIFVGRECGSIRKDGYRRVSFKGGIISAHRLAWLLHFGEWPDGAIDHINRIRDDNRIANLRIATPKENAMNRAARKPGQMRHGGTGVSWLPKKSKWQVQVHDPKRGRPVYGGIYACKQEALTKAQQMRLELDL